MELVFNILFHLASSIGLSEDNEAFALATVQAINAARRPY
ncbi:unnamed protein product, partial [Rotaria magnacalcarata]